MRQSIRQNDRNNKTQTISIPAPTGGWNRRDSLAAMPITDAIVMDNWMPKQSSVELREGYTLCAQTFGDTGANSLIAYNAADNIRADVPSGFVTESENKLFKNEVPLSIKKGAMENFPQLFKNSIRVKSYADMKGIPRIKQIHRYIAPIKYGDEVYPANIVVKEFKDGSRKVLLKDIIGFNKGKDLSVYNMSINEKLPRADARAAIMEPRTTNGMRGSGRNIENPLETIKRSINKELSRIRNAADRATLIHLQNNKISIKDLTKNIKDTSGEYDFSYIGRLKSEKNYLILLLN